MPDATPLPAKPLGVVPQQQRGVEKRTRIFDAAIKELSRRGVDGARVDAIVAEADVAWGTFFHYFPRKEDVLLSAGVDLQRRFEAALDSASDDPASTIHDVVLAAYEVMAKPQYTERLHVEIAREILASPTRFRQMLDPNSALAYNRVATLLELGQWRGEIRNDIDAATMARILNGAVLLTFARGGVSGGTGLAHGTDLTGLMRATFRVVWAGIEIEAEGRPAVGP